VGPTHVYRCTVGHMLSHEPVKALGLGAKAAGKRAVARQTGGEGLVARVAARGCGVKHCARRCGAGVGSLFGCCGCGGGGGGREEFDRSQPTDAELKDAGVTRAGAEADAAAAEAEAAAEGAALTASGDAAEADPDGLASWLGWIWGGDSDSDDEDGGGGGDGGKLPKRGRQDPMLVKLRFRRYADHVNSY